MASCAHSTGPRPQAPIAVSSRFDWLEGATGVRLATGARDHTRFVCVTGDVDRASIDVIQTALLATRSVRSIRWVTVRRRLSPASPEASSVGAVADRGASRRGAWLMRDAPRRL
jgi:hypothetical protein